MRFATALSLVLLGFGVVGVFIPIPFDSEYASWIMVAAYIVGAS